MTEPGVVAILLYDQMTALDAIGPYEVLSRLPGLVTKFVGTERGLKRTDKTLGLMADHLLEEVMEPRIVLVPGGPGQAAIMKDERVLSWISQAHQTSTWTTAVCTGSLILAGAGIMNGVRATSHWLALEELGRLGAVPVAERVVFDGKIVTGAGVSAGIDLALQLAERVSGEETARSIQLWIEYDPQPPFNAGNPRKANNSTVEELRRQSRFHRSGAK